MTAGQYFLLLDPDPQAEYDRLDKAGRRALLDRIDDAFDALELDPGAKGCRERAFGNGTFGITVWDHAGDWLIIWEPADTDEHVIAISYIGPDPFA